MMNKEKWEVRKLGDLCTIQLGKTPYRKDSKLWDKTKSSNNIWLSIADLRHGERIYDSTEYISDAGADNMTIIPKDTILLSFKLTLGRVSFAGTDLYTNEAIASLLNLNKVISKEFLFYYFTFFDWDKAAEGDIKVKGKTLNKRKLQDLPILFPSITEQQRIVSLLDEAFESIDQAKAIAEKNLENAKELFESYRDSFFYSKEWEVKLLGDVCTHVEYGTSSKSDKQGEVPVLRMGNIQNGFIDWEDLVYTNNKDEINRYLLKYNDVLFNRTNSYELVGKTAIYKGESPAIFAGYLIRIHRNEKLLDADYLNYYLNSKKASEYGKTVVTSSVNQANINGTKLKSYPIPLPPIEVQQSIVSRLDNIRLETLQLESQYQTKLENLEELRKSILEKAFNGEL